MEKIKLATGIEIAIDTIECLESPEALLNITMPKGLRDLTDFLTIFGTAANTKTITLLDEEDQEIEVYTNYTNLGALKFDPPMKMVSVSMEKADETALRLADLEVQMTDAQMALCDIYELLIG